MPYESTINFTLDTICPWTYLAKRRLAKALSQVRDELGDDPPVTFTLHYHPYQLYSDAPTVGEDKYQWYLKEKYNNDEERMRKYELLMKAYGVGEGIEFKFGGTIAGTLEAHRIIQYWQEKKGPETADAIVNSLYEQYFEQERHPSSKETLLKACVDAGIPEAEAEPVVEDEGEGLQDVKMMIREQASNGVDAVPHLMIEGKRRDFTLTGAKEVPEYVKSLQQVVKEVS